MDLPQKSSCAGEVAILLLSNLSKILLASSTISLSNPVFGGDSQYVGVSRTHPHGICKSTTYKGPL